NNMASLLGVFFTCFVFIATTNGLVDAVKEFKVGDELGWHQPSPNNTMMYTQWAAMIRFHVGDSLTFEYQNDSVLVVDKFDYYHCNTSEPITAFNDGKTVIKLDRPGSFYFISGVPDHCKNGQRLFIDVMGLHPDPQSPPWAAFPPFIAPAPAPSSALLVSVTFSSMVMPLIALFVTLFRCAS
ncbi:Cu_bind_like domain-containing protein, partial [Cephalotus follicularis]